MHETKIFLLPRHDMTCKELLFTFHVLFLYIFFLTFLVWFCSCIQTSHFQKKKRKGKNYKILSWIVIKWFSSLFYYLDHYVITRVRFVFLRVFCSLLKYKNQWLKNFFFSSVKRVSNDDFGSLFPYFLLFYNKNQFFIIKFPISSSF